MSNNVWRTLREAAQTAALSAAALFIASAAGLAQDGFGDFPDVDAEGVEAPEVSETQKSFVLTRSDSIYEGILYDRGTTYLLEFDGGGSTTISKLDAIYIGSSRESVFRYKMSQTPMEDVNEVLKLADWASRRQLAQEAIAALNERMASSRDQGEQAALAQKIKALKQAEAFRTEAAKNYAQKAAANAATREAQKAKAKQEPQGPESELEAWGKAVPAATLERFSKRGQPVLQKRCATAECHGSQHTSHYVLRPKAMGPAARLALFYNLRATVDYVNFDNIEESPILIHPEVTNGAGERVYPFGEDRSSLKDCETFMKWLKSLPDEEVLAKHAKATRRVHNPPILKAGAASRYDSVDRERAKQDPMRQDNAEANAPQAAGTEDFSQLFDETESAETSNAQESQRKGTNGILGFGTTREAQKYMPKPEDDVNSGESLLKRAGMKPKKKYRDEYDPAIFNDKFHSNKQ